MGETIGVLMIFAWIISGGIAVAVNVLLSMWFSKMAAEKGYNKVLFFWICVFFGMFMFLIIAMLPDRVQQERLKRLEKILQGS